MSPCSELITQTQLSINPVNKSSSQIQISGVEISKYDFLLTSVSPYSSCQALCIVYHTLHFTGILYIQLIMTILQRFWRALEFQTFNGVSGEVILYTVHSWQYETSSLCSNRKPLTRFRPSTQASATDIIFSFLNPLFYPFFCGQRQNINAIWAN